MHIYLIAQLIGAVAVIISLTIYQLNQRSQMLKLGSAAGFLYAVHFYLLGAMTGAALNLVGGAREYSFSLVKPGKGKRWLFWAFVAASVLATWLTWNGFISLLALGGNIAFAISGWQPYAKGLRRVGLFAPPLWFSYNFIVGSYPGMFIEVFMIVSNVIGQYRYDLRKRPLLAKRQAVK